MNCFYILREISINIFSIAKISVFNLIRENRGRFSYQIMIKPGEVPKICFESKLVLSSNLKLVGRVHSRHQMGSARTVPNLVEISDDRIGERVSICGQSVPISRSF